ncbi:MAG: tetratricopeptide repeat protein [Ktedonobacteraceae bacterium]|nr:tetratricopeptide repeat protein [Ktedonobacteraceae bacterium]
MSHSPDHFQDDQQSLADRPGCHLPAQLTSFVGREREISEIASLFSTTRLLTLTGVGGVGKTRLALHVAHECVHEGRTLFADGIWFISLAHLRHPADIFSVLAQTLGLGSELEQGPLTEICAFLCAKKALLILDSCERLIESCARLAETLLQTCPALRILATSRETLRVSGETVYCLLPLAVPACSANPAPEDLAQAGATALFLDRARAIHPCFCATTSNAAVLVEICRQLDGLPLAIELAATCIRVMSTEQIAAQVSDGSGGRFRLLTGGSRTALPQQQSLRATLDWSYDLLSATEQRLLLRLAIFAGGWTLEAAQAICTTEKTGDLPVLDGLARLVNTSLVLVDRQTGVHTSATGTMHLVEQMRYTLLETVRQYALEKLRETGEEQALQQKHLTYFLTLAEKTEPELRGACQLPWLAYLDLERENFQAALTYARRQHLYETGLRLANALWWFWVLRAHFSPGRAWLEEVVNQQEQITPALRAIAFYRAGVLAFFQGDLERLDVLTEKSLSLFRTLQDTQGVAVSLSNLVHVALRQRNHKRAQELGEESVTLARTVGDRWYCALTLLPLAVLSIRQKDYASASELIKEALWLFRLLGDRWGMAYAFDTLGQLADDQHDPVNSMICYEQSLKFFEPLNDRIGAARVLLHLGLSFLKQEKYPQASSFLEESLKLCQQAGRRIGVARALLGLARIKLHHHDYRQAALLLADSLPILREHGDVRGFADALDSLRNIALHQSQSWQVRLLLQQSLGGYYHIDEPSDILTSLETIADSASAQTALSGRMRPADWLKRVIGILHEMESTSSPRQVVRGSDVRDIVEENLFVTALAHPPAFPKEAALLSRSASASKISPSVPPAALQIQGHLFTSLANPLTDREQEVLRLVECGLSNAQIARRLVISVGTVRTHLASMYRKLGVTSRTAAVHFAHEHHLL